MSEAYATSPGHARGDDLRQLVEMLAPQPDWRVLDVATGAGHTAVAVAARVRWVLATDLTPEMLSRTRELALARGAGNVSTAGMDVERLALPDAIFDAATCRIAPHHFLDPAQAMREIARVLKPGGWFAVEDNVVPDDPGLDRFLNEVQRMRDPTHLRAYTGREWRRMLEAAGLTVTQVRDYRGTGPVPEWLDRAGMDEAGKERVYRALAAASSEAVRHYELRFGPDGRAAWMTDDKMLVLARKSG